MKHAISCSMILGLPLLACVAGGMRYEESNVVGHPTVASGIEICGSADGISTWEWDTTLLDDGWTTLNNGGRSTPVLVLNGPAVVGGRLSENQEWQSDRVYVVRDDVVVPAGVTLTLSTGCVVKFLPGTHLEVEAGGALVAYGAVVADFADDTAGGDTNMDADASAPSEGEEWLSPELLETFASVEWRDGAASVCPKRLYSLGVEFGSLPLPSKIGATFAGWYTEADGQGLQIDAKTEVSKSFGVLYVNWDVHSLQVSPVEMDVAASGGAKTLTIGANAEWSVACHDDWIVPGVVAGSGNADCVLTLKPNKSRQSRSGSVRVSLASGVFRDVAVKQEAMCVVETPTIEPCDGISFMSATRRISLSCETVGAMIYYTTDGSEPDESSKIYGGVSFNIFDTTVIKARAYRDDMLPSDVRTASIVRMQTLAEAVDAPTLNVSTEAEHSWTVAFGAGVDGKSCARSGEIADGDESYLAAEVLGSGELTFRWRTSCEDDPDVDSWDYLALIIDGEDVRHLDGETGWESVSVKVQGTGSHQVKWIYHKDDMAGTSSGEDCGWVDRVSWMPTTEALSVPVTWIESQGLVNDGVSVEVAATLDPDGDGLTTAQEYIAGTDPTDPESKFTAMIEMVDGVPTITWEPDLQADEQPRAYKTWGSKDLKTWKEIPAGKYGDYNFFKVSVEMPK